MYVDADECDEDQLKPSTHVSGLKYPPNKTQEQALLTALQSPFTLIQGPPGELSKSAFNTRLRSVTCPFAVNQDSIVFLTLFIFCNL